MQVGNRYRRSDRRRWLNTTLVTGLIGINAWLWAGIMFGTVRPPAVGTAWLSLLTLSSASALVLAIGVWGRSSIHHRRMLSVPALRQAWATHQAGHLVATYLADPDRLHTTAISDECPGRIPRLPVVTESAIRAEMRILFGGVAAEEIFAGESGSHASGDLARASSIAAAMVGRYGMAGSPVSMMPAATPGPHLLQPGPRRPSHEEGPRGDTPGNQARYRARHAREASRGHRACATRCFANTDFRQTRFGPSSLRPIGNVASTTRSSSISE